MKGLGMMLKALGIEIPPDQLQMIQALIPQIPAKLNEAGTVINNALQNFDQRLKALEDSQQKLIALLEQPNGKQPGSTGSNSSERTN